MAQHITRDERGSHATGEGMNTNTRTQTPTNSGGTMQANTRTTDSDGPTPRRMPRTVRYVTTNMRGGRVAIYRGGIHVCTCSDAFAADEEARRLNDHLDATR